MLSFVIHSIICSPRPIARGATPGSRPRCRNMDPYDLLPNIRQLALFPHIRDLAIADGLAFLIEWNREREDRSAGLRTFPLVAIAACGFLQATEGLLRGEAEGMARVVEGVIGGIGFIGGGAILKGEGLVHGTATAASLWAIGAIGIAAGLAAYDVAVAICLFTFLTLYALSRLKPKDRGA
jgi:putative Mg2+ transporter-C (MgtC) family protein